MADTESDGSGSEHQPRHVARLKKYVALASLREADEEVGGCGLTYGITAWHLRILCDDSLNGGHGYTPNEVAEMTPDQIYFLLCDRSLLKRTEGRRTKRVVPAKGTLKGRTADGQQIEAAVGGKTMLQLIQERQQAEQRKGRRRGRKK